MSYVTAKCFKGIGRMGRSTASFISFDSSHAVTGSVLLYTLPHHCCPDGNSKATESMTDPHWGKRELSGLDGLKSPSIKALQ